MLLFLYLILGFLVGALLQRFVGGLLSVLVGKNLGSFPPRTLLAAAHGLVLFLLTNSIEFSVLYAIGIWVGCAAGMWSGLGMGRYAHSLKIVNFKTWLRDFGFMTFYGFCKIVVPGIVALAMGLTYWWIILMAGLTCGALYELAYRYPLDIKILGCQGKNNPAGCDPPPTAELLFGGTVLSGTILLGYLQSDKIISLIDLAKNLF